MTKAIILSPARALKTVSVLLLLLFPLVASPTPTPRPSVAACACCAEPGEWFERTAKIQSFEWEEIRKVDFDSTAKLYMTVAGYEDMKGLPAQSESFNLSDSNRGRALTLTFKAERGETGSLVLALPAVATSFGSDLRDAPEGSAGPILYKEWRFQGGVRGSGMFRRGIAPGTKFRLVLQGRGNNCLSATDFTHWRLEITGPRADYAFYGSLSNPG